jgi:hypothetical protein
MESTPSTLSWAPDGRLHERFLVWKKEIDIACLEIQMKHPTANEKMVKSLIVLKLKQWVGPTGEIEIDRAISNKATVNVEVEKADKSGLEWKDSVLTTESPHTWFMKYLETCCKPAGCELIAAQAYRTLAQGSQETPEFFEECIRVVQRMRLGQKLKGATEELNAATVREIEDRLVRNAFIFGLKSKVSYEKARGKNPQDKTAAKVAEEVRQSEFSINTGKNLTALAQEKTVESALHSLKSQKKSTACASATQSSLKPKFDKKKDLLCFTCGNKGICKKGECKGSKHTCATCSTVGHSTKACGLLEKFRKARKDKPKKKEDVKELEYVNDEGQRFLLIPRPDTTHHYSTVHDLTAGTHGNHIKTVHLEESGFTGHQYKLEIELDSGASCSVLPKYVFDALKQKILKPSNTSILAYGKQPVKIYGECLLDIIIGQKRHQEKFQVTEATGFPILGRNAAQKMGFLSLNDVAPPVAGLLKATTEVQHVKEMSTYEGPPITQILQQTHKPAEERILEEVPDDAYEYLLKEQTHVLADFHELSVNDAVTNEETHDVPPSASSTRRAKKAANGIILPEITHDDHFIIANGKKHPFPLTEDYIRAEYKDVFEGIGQLPGGEYSITMKDDAKPVQHAARSVPEKKKPAYLAEIQRLLRLGIIAEVKEHTPWINSIVPAQKANGDIRLCLDPKDLNLAMERNPVYSKTVAEIQAELGRSKPNYFTLFDAKWGFWMVLLSRKSSFLTTFNTPWGKY